MRIQVYADRSGKSDYLEWLAGLDAVTSRRIKRYVDRLGFGMGDVKYLGNKLHELRIDFGPGYRVYFMRKGNEVMIILGGSAKVDQDRAIARAKRIASNL